MNAHLKSCRRQLVLTKNTKQARVGIDAERRRFRRNSNATWRLRPEPRKFVFGKSLRSEYDSNKRIKSNTLSPCIPFLPRWLPALSLSPPTPYSSPVSPPVSLPFFLAFVLGFLLEFSQSRPPVSTGVFELTNRANQLPFPSHVFMPFLFFAWAHTHTHTRTSCTRIMTMAAMTQTYYMRVSLCIRRQIRGECSAVTNLFRPPTTPDWSPLSQHVKK